MDSLLTEASNLTSPPPTTQWEQSRWYSYQEILPFNLFLVIAITFQNSLFIYDYFQKRKELITSLFNLIAISNISVALGEILRAGVALNCIHNPTGNYTPLFWIPRSRIVVGSAGPGRLS